jgi:hypothetical protein
VNGHGRTTEEAAVPTINDSMAAGLRQPIYSDPSFTAAISSPRASVTHASFGRRDERAWQKEPYNGGEIKANQLYQSMRIEFCV